MNPKQILIQQLKMRLQINKQKRLKLFKLSLKVNNYFLIL
jgi:hypothetical protein